MIKSHYAGNLPGGIVSWLVLYDEITTIVLKQITGGVFKRKEFADWDSKKKLKVQECGFGYSSWQDFSKTMLIFLLKTSAGEMFLSLQPE